MTLKTFKNDHLSLLTCFSKNLLVYNTTKDDCSQAY